LRMTEELLFKGEAAVEYDRAFAHVTRYFMPFLLRAADVGSGMRVLDIATGTGLSAEAVLAVVGPLGEASRLKSLFTEAGFVDIETHTEKHIFVLPSFDAYYGPFERGGASTGKHWPRCPTKYAGLFARRCSGTSVTRAVQSNRRPSIASLVAGASDTNAI
jgi:hypothetical protein